MPQLTLNVHSPSELRLVSRYLDELAAMREAELAEVRAAGNTALGAMLGGNELSAAVAQQVQRGPSNAEVFAATARIKPEDNPATGMPEARDAFKAPSGDPAAPPIDPVAAFRPALPLPVAVPNLPASLALPLPPTLPAPSPAPAAAPSPGSASAATAAVPPAGVTLDAEGLTWDGRIHSTPAKLTEKGVWRRKRGLNDGALEARVKAELKAALGAPAPAAPPAVLSPAGAMAHRTPVAAPSALPLPPPPASSPAPVAGSASDAPTTLPALLQLLTPAMSLGAVTLDAVNAACVKHGVPNFAALAARPDLIPAVWSELKALCGAQ